MKLICPNCGEVKQYKVKENACRDIILDTFGNKVKQTKYNTFNLGKPRCIACNSKLQVKLSEALFDKELLVRT